MDQHLETEKPESTPEGLTLRALRPADAEQFHAMQQLPAVVNGNPHAPFRTLASTREYLEKLEPTEIAIAAIIGDTLVGEAELTPLKGRRSHAGSIGIGVHDAWHRRGIGNALMTELLDLADNWLGLRRVELHVFADNHAALALYRKFGFEIEARQRGAVLRRGVLIDCYFMARLRDAAPLMSMHRATQSATPIAAE
ncbi:GNAT family N-acetyltransferase [Paraburkholderia sp. 22099]|jgi:L-phenylalanine/L-methionine N-acetyltransferase|uniref:Acetyltransferase n=1 Tax=Paraburkholderia terricola TaxID=169427 RepID=A0A1M6RQK5_9BURK|nr:MULTISPECIES: GNAT family N-acetyltransferase [Paraburkholderia]AXE92960.1 alanine acetyltransferase [Paraburkholderia terricola]MDR6410561.1 putative acetyltransferase [Paraburkholderia terricola]MDR6481014.1 putative acetyltransferase [Paraburkholderia terricola]MDR6493725.1 putative acetyltransferase [Paraburkholderia terricola]SDO52143.1 putative acetyltransferase [Paraburkholderia sediminicola]